MKEEVLQEIKKELLLKKEEVELFNKTSKRIFELQQDPAVREYESLIKSISGFPRILSFDETNVLRGIYNRFSNTVNENESNGIYVYLGSYYKANDSKIGDIVDYNSPNVTHREYQDIERINSIFVSVDKSGDFESKNTVIKPMTFSKRQEFYKIQDDFLVESVNHGQEYAKRYILSKYRKM